VRRNLFSKSISDQFRPFCWWTLGVAALVLLSQLTYPSVRDAPDLNEFIQNLPESFRALIGGDLDLTSPAGYLSARLFSFLLPILFLIYGSSMGASTIAGEEGRGTLDLLLAYPLSRSRVVLEKFLAIAVVLIALSAALWLLLWFSAKLVQMEISAGKLAAATISLLLLALLFAALALAVGCVTGRWAVAIGVCAALGLGGYLLNSLAPLAGWLEPLQVLSPFYYYSESRPLRNGLDRADAAILAAAVLLLVVVAVPGFERRDIAV